MYASRKYRSIMCLHTIAIIVTSQFIVISQLCLRKIRRTHHFLNCWNIWRRFLDTKKLTSKTLTGDEWKHPHQQKVDPVLPNHQHRLGLPTTYPMKSRMNTGWKTKGLLSFNMNRLIIKKWQDITTRWFQTSSKKTTLKNWTSAQKKKWNSRKKPVLKLETTWVGEYVLPSLAGPWCPLKPTCKRCFIFRIFTEDPSSVR